MLLWKNLLKLLKGTLIKMMNNIRAGLGLEVTGPYQPYLDKTGLIRWNGTTQLPEVMTNDGTSYGNQWVPFAGGDTQIGLAPAYENAIHWAMVKMQEEAELKKLLDKHPGLKDLKEKYEVMLALVREHESDSDK